MGACASSQCTSKGGELCWQIFMNIIHLNSKLKQFKEPIKAGHALSQNPNCFLYNLDSMYVGSLLPHVDPNKELQLNQIHFMMPLSKSHIHLSLQYLCALAIKANAALVHSEATNSILNSSSPSKHVVGMFLLNFRALKNKLVEFNMMEKYIRRK